MLRPITNYGTPMLPNDVRDDDDDDLSSNCAFFLGVRSAGCP